VQHVDFNGTIPPRESGREPQRSRIDIALHSLDRCNGTKLVEDDLRPNIAGMQDLIDIM
jgi:hypothetical protein